MANAGITPQANTGSPPLLATKLYLARVRPGVVPRPRLTGSLDQTLLHYPLTLISAGAGFGKTTLLAQWHASEAGRAIPLGWLSLDGDDSVPARFWTYLVAALATAVPGFGSDILQLLRSAQPPPQSVLLPLLCNALAGLTTDVVLVLEDYHLVESPAVDEGLVFLVERMPPWLHLIVVTRVDPPWPLARWRARTVMAELRASDLRFTRDEVCQYLHEATALPLTDAEVETLEARTEGWIAGLQMAALSLRGRTDTEEFVRSFAGTNRYILDFLLEEVLTRQPEEVQQFLLYTAVLDRFTAALCEAVLGQDGAGALLEKLERANLFLVPLDDQRRWYRYHHLFAELLRARLSQHEPAAAPELCGRAGEWCEKEGYVTEALSYHLAAGNHERAAQVAEGSCLKLIPESNLAFITLLMKLPDEVLRRRAWLCTFRAHLDYAWGRFESAKKYLCEAERLAQADGAPADAREVFAFVAYLSGFIGELEGGRADLPALAKTALEVVPESKRPLRNSFNHWLATGMFLRGDFTAAEAAWTRQIQEDLRSGATNAFVPALVGLIRMHEIQGRLPEAGESLRRWLRYIDERGRWRFFRAGDLSTRLGELHLELNDLPEALDLVGQGLKDGELWRAANGLAIGYVGRARVLRALGRAGEALAALGELEHRLEGHTIFPDLQSDLLACRADVHLAQGDVAAAARWVDETLIEDTRLGFRRERDAIALARVLLARGEHARALALLARLEGAARLGVRTGRLIEILALQAHAYHVQKDTARGLAILSGALTLAEPAGYVRVFLDAGQPVVDLLRRLAGVPDPGPGRPRFSAEYVERLCSASAGVSPASIPLHTTRSHPAPAIAGRQDALLPSVSDVFVENLSERELEVLRLMAAGLTNQQIAAKLILAPGTVKVHIHNICGKLGAQNRTHAIARATELALL